MVIFDTNAILRYILQDNQAMADEVEQQLFDCVCFIPVEVVAEIVYVLSKVYGLKRDVIAQTLTDIADLDNIKIAQKPVVLHALGVYAAITLDFVDCLLIGYAKENGHTIFTFDKKLQKYLNR
jgi:predicted nucleic-acid-binding protein